MSQENLRDYVKRITKLKGLSNRDVQRLSGGKITDSYVASIKIGRAHNLSAEKLAALAEGLGVDLDELFHIACGAPEPLVESQKNKPDLALILEIMQKAVLVPELPEILNEFLCLSSDERETFLKYFKRLNETRQKPGREAKPA
ncbi:MAG TPA: helix-turn-helix transcriptional regulator [Blastocatellia bacterium]|nr:helix-turn-helix transcriptional regulator [Blastocatellia bacterium]